MEIQVESPLGLVNVEAMCFGKPVVTCGEGGPAEVVRDGVEGLVVGEDPEFDKHWFRRTDDGVTLITQPMIDKYLAEK